MAHPAKRFFGSFLFLVATLLTISFFFILYAESVGDEDVPLTDQVKDTAYVVAGVLAAIFLVLLIMVIVRGRKEPAPEPAPAAAPVDFLPMDTEQPGVGIAWTGDIVVYDLARMAQGKRTWEFPELEGTMHPFYFPKAVPAGVYVNDYIDVGRGHQLKLRTLMAGPPEFGEEIRTAAVRPPRPLPLPVPRPVILSSGRSQFVSRLEQRIARKPAPPSAPDVYYDYPGDVHEVEEIEGIGAIYGQKLRDVGVHTTARLCYEDAESLAQKIGVPRRTVESWKAMAELIKIKGVGKQYAEVMARAGIEGIAELKKRKADDIAAQVNKYLKTLEIDIEGNVITGKRVANWQEDARDMRRIRQKVPEK